MSAFLKRLKERGLNGVRLIISDTCLGLAESVAEFFRDAVWQRCVVHRYRNIFSHVSATKVREIAAMLKAIHASEDVVAARVNLASRSGRHLFSITPRALSGRSHRHHCRVRG